MLGPHRWLAPVENFLLVNVGARVVGPVLYSPEFTPLKKICKIQHTKYMPPEIKEKEKASTVPRGSGFKTCPW